MAVEIEAKMRLADETAVASLIERLRGVGAERVGAVVSTEVYLDRPDGSLHKSDSGLRVRMQRAAGSDSAGDGGGTGDGGDADGDLAGIRAWVTFKGPRGAGEFKVREEIESAVGDGEAVLILLERLGMVANVRYQKRRETWRLGGCTVELDRVPLLGRFVEIEGPNEAAVKAVRDQLGLSETPIEKKAYVSLLIDELERRGDERRVIGLCDQ